MQQDYQNRLLNGENLSGFLRIIDAGEQASIPGYIRLLENGQLEVALVVEAESREYVAAMPGHQIFHNGRMIKPRNFPKTCYFESAGGMLTLVNIGILQPKTHILGRPLEVILQPQFVIAHRIDNEAWKQPYALRVEIGGLAHWMHASSIARSFKTSVSELKVATLQEVTVSMREFSALNYSIPSEDKSLEVTFRPLTDVSRSKIKDGASLIFQTFLEVCPSEPSAWRDILEVLNHLQDLVNLLSWKSHKSRNLMGRFQQVNTFDTEQYETIGVPVPSEDKNYCTWQSIYNGQFLSTIQPIERDQHKFILPFGMLNSSTLSNWFSLRKDLSHALELFLQVIDQPWMSPQMKTLQLGAGLESLGYIQESQQTSKKRADSTPTVKLFDLVAIPATQRFPEIFQDWAKEANDAYQSMKHLKRRMPSVGKIAEINDRSSLVIQIWLAENLGPDDKAINDYIKQSFRSRSSYTQVPDPSSF